MKGLLVRVGIDSTDGEWNGPVRTKTGEFGYVTITEEAPLRPGMATLYDQFVPVVQRFEQSLPFMLRGKPTHLDPDFDHLTYGDRGQRGARVSTLGPGDFLAFFAALCPIDAPPRPLCYALIGLYVIDEIVAAHKVLKQHWAKNAHTRRVPVPDDIVVRAKAGVSGRLRQCIPIGELRGGHYRVRQELLDAWGGLDIKDGYIQRSVRLPGFSDPAQFYRWFLAQKPEVVAANNPV